MRNAAGRIVGGLLGATLLAGSAYAQDASYLSLSLEDLTNIEVTSVSKKSEKASEAAAAIYVITNEDLIRSGAINVAEALRMVPGMQVAHTGAAQWAVSSRGFNDQFANKLLVLIDGRSVYTPNFSGVWWDVQNVVLEDVERIEVIRGPGASLWGANAVNGVINVITKKAKDTQGSFVTAGAGSNRLAFGTARHGGKLGPNGHYRIYAKHDQIDEARASTGNIGVDDEWNISQAGFRADIDGGDGKTSLTLQGDAYTSEQEQVYQPPIPTLPFQTSVLDDQTVLGANLMAKWNRVISERSNFSLQGYVDFAQRDISFVNLTNVTVDLDMQHDMKVSDWHQMTWGVGVRYLDDELEGGPFLRFDPVSRDRFELSGFMQSKFEVVEDLSLTLGTKLEYNEFTEVEIQPSARTAYLIDDDQTLWASVSRAVRTPSRSARDLINVVSPVPALGNALAIRSGSESAESEQLIAYEIGYRAQPTNHFALDMTAFYNQYSDLIVNQVGTPFNVIGDPNFGNFLQVPITLANGGEADAYGFEAAFNYNPFEWWKLAASYNFIKLDVDSNGQATATNASTTPQQQVNMRSYLQLAEGMQFDQALYYVDQFAPSSTVSIPDYWRLDLRFAVQLKDHLQFSIVGQNLLDPEHPEFSQFLYNGLTQVPRSVFGQLRWDF